MHSHIRNTLREYEYKNDSCRKTARCSVFIGAYYYFSDNFNLPCDHSGTGLKMQRRTASEKDNKKTFLRKKLCKSKPETEGQSLSRPHSETLESHYTQINLDLFKHIRRLYSFDSFLFSKRRNRSRGGSVDMDRGWEHNKVSAAKYVVWRTTMKTVMAGMAAATTFNSGRRSSQKNTLEPVTEHTEQPIFRNVSAVVMDFAVRLSNWLVILFQAIQTIWHNPKQNSPPGPKINSFELNAFQTRQVELD